jgi:hypothetical protein
MNSNDKEELDKILRLLFNEGQQAWYKVYTSLAINKGKADHLYKIGKAHGYITTRHKGLGEFPNDNQYVDLTDPGIKFFSMSNFSELDDHTTFGKSSTIINNTGDGAIINTGHSNTIKSSFIKWDRDNLRQELLKAKVTELDIDELFEVIDQEPPATKGNYSSKVNSWIIKMLNKAADGTWQIGVGAAGGFLATILANYYGL